MCVYVGVGGVPPEDNLAPVDRLYLSETTDVDLLWKQVAEAESLAHAVQPSLQTAVSAQVKLPPPPPTNLAFHNTTQHNTTRQGKLQQQLNSATLTKPQVDFCAFKGLLRRRGLIVKRALR